MKGYVMDKKKIFIAHISEEKEIALLVKTLIDNAFLNMLEVFIFSDENSIGLGEKWLEQITNALSTCNIELILCSPKSIIQPWINFEAGSGWIRKIPVIPLCHSGLIPSNLPLPLNLLQAATLSEVSNLKILLPVLANTIGSKIPEYDFLNFIKEVKEFEMKYTFWDECNKNFKKLNQINNQIIQALRTGQTIIINLTELEINFINELMKFFTPNELISFQRIGNTKFMSNGIYYDYQLIPLNKINNILTDKNFNLK